MKEGTGKPLAPDVAIDANVKARELYFEVVPDTKVCFWGNTRRNSVWRSSRKNLPDEVQEGVVYRNATVQLLIASEIADSDSGSEVNSSPGTGKERSTGTGKGQENESTAYLDRETEE